MSEFPPLLFTWNGEAMLPYHAKQADKYFTIGERYLLVEAKQRSANSHSHYFAALNDAWENLPEQMIDNFPTIEHLRKFALIRTGYHDSQSIVCANKAEAQRVAAFVKNAEDFAVTVVTEATVTRYTAKSQSRKAMGNEDFQKSKQAVLDYVATLIGSNTAELSQNAMGKT